jgi:predicted permease
MLRKHPGLSLTVIVTLALGIGFSSTVFNITNGFIHKPLPFEQADRILVLGRTGAESVAQETGVATVHDLVDWRAQQTAFEELAGFTTGSVNLALDQADERPGRHSAAWFTAGVFEALRVQPTIGRTFGPDEERPGAEPVVIVGYAIWQRLFGGADEVLGHTVIVDGVHRTVVGVMPEGFAFPNVEELWLPLQIDPNGTARGDGPRLSVLGRLAHDSSVASARAEMTAIAARLAQEHPDSNEGVGVQIRTLKRALVPAGYYPLFYTMVAAALAVLLIGCVNVANLLLARASTRAREVAVRAALGAGRGRLISQLSTEVLILAVIGGVLGFYLGHLGLQWFLRQMNDVMAVAGAGETLPFWVHFEPDIRVVLFVVIATLIAAFFAGVLPAVRVSRSGLAQDMQPGTGGASALRAGRLVRGLVVTEVAVSCVLLVLAGLMIKGVLKLSAVELAYDTDNIFTARLQLPESGYPDVDSRLAFDERLLAELEAIPSVINVGLADNLPPLHVGAWSVEVEGVSYERDEDVPFVRRGVATPDYFRTFGVSVIQGRSFRATDRSGALPVALVNSSFVRRFFLDGDAVGRRIRVTGMEESQPWLTVIGVVPDLEAFPMGGDGVSTAAQNPAAFYVPLAQSGGRSYVTMALRTQGPPMAIAAEVQAAVASIDPELPLFMVLSMDDVIYRMVWFYPVLGTLFTAFGAGALFLAAIGLYGVMSFTVARRTAEMGVRMALGARGGELVALVMRRSLTQMAIGLAIGLLLALLAVNPLQLVLFEVDAYDPAVFVLVLVTLAVTGLVASFLPARRATRIDPITALGSD